MYEKYAGHVDLAPTDQRELPTASPEELFTRLERLLKRVEQATPDEWLTVDRAAKILKVSKKWIYKEAHELPWLKRVNERLWRVSRNGLQKWMESH